MTYKLGLKHLDDPRREEFSKFVPTKDVLPSQFGYSSQYPPIDNQGEIGDCVAYGNGKIFEYAYQKAHQAPITISKRALFSQIKHNFYPDDLVDDGAQVSDGLKILEQNYVLEKDWAEELSNFSVILEVVPDNIKHMDFEFKNFVAVNIDVNDLKNALYSCGPIVIGINWAASWFNTGSDGRMPQFDSSAGGHCISISDWYDDFENIDGSKGAFYGPNNWDTNWGKAGWFYLPYNQISYISDAFTVSV